MSATTLIGTERRSSLQPRPQMTQSMTDQGHERFPSLDLSASNPLSEYSKSPEDINPLSQPSPWLPRQRQDFRDSRFGHLPYKHRSRKSVGEALGNFKARRGSVSANAQELAESLKAPVSWKLIALCIAWYLSSALTNTSSKSILNAFPKPITLTIIQFAFVSLWCLVFAYLASVFPSLKTTIPALKNGLRYPSPEVMLTALPLAVFQLLGHILSATATSKIPVSLVHTIKGLSPLFTVLAYRLFFRIRYARATYLSLIPLTVGVMLACSADFSTNFVGISCAFTAAIVFVTQNIFSKKLFNEASRAEAEGHTANSRRLDKLNLLCYCSGGAFLLTTPVWLLFEGFTIMGDFWHDGKVDLTKKKDALDHGPLMLEFVFNGIFHFGQNILAFILLSMLSPVSYSVASLIKRVWVVVIAIFWFGNSTTSAQWIGIVLTFLGLYLYDRNSMDDAAERRANADHFRKQALLPLTEESESHPMNGHAVAPMFAPAFQFPGPDAKKEDDSVGSSRQRASSFSKSMLPGTKQESTWEPGDVVPKL